MNYIFKKLGSFNFWWGTFSTTRLQSYQFFLHSSFLEVDPPTTALFDLMKVIIPILWNFFKFPNNIMYKNSLFTFTSRFASVNTCSSNFLPFQMKTGALRVSFFLTPSYNISKVESKSLNFISRFFGKFLFLGYCFGKYEQIQMLPSRLQGCIKSFHTYTKKHWQRNHPLFLST